VVAAYVLLQGSSTLAQQTQPKSESQQSLDKIIQNLKALDTAYASGNTAEAQSDFDTASNGWKSLSSKISARESREVQLLFDSIQTKLKDKAPAKDVSNVVHGTIEELRETSSAKSRTRSSRWCPRIFFGWPSSICVQTGSGAPLPWFSLHRAS
jgi:hypothetical protein